MIYEKYIGDAFEIYPEKSGQIAETDPMVNLFKETLDARTKYLCKTYPSNKQNPLSDVDWYINYLNLNVHIFNEGPVGKPAGYQNGQAYHMLNIGYVPIGYCPSFAQEMTVALNKILEQKKIPFIRYFATSFVFPFYKWRGSDLWVSKMVAAELLHCPPEKVTSVDLFKEVIR